MKSIFRDTVKLPVERNNLAIALFTKTSLSKERRERAM